MGHTLEKLAEKKIREKSIFNNRFCIEICERVHTHYRNLRIVQSLDDFIIMAEGFRDSVERWKKRGCPGTGELKHIELCRKNIFIADADDRIQVNLNKNLYNVNQGKIFSDGANFIDDKYIHVKIRDIRLEMSIAEFKELSDAIAEANQRLEDCSISPVL